MLLVVYLSGGYAPRCVLPGVDSSLPVYNPGVDSSLPVYNPGVGTLTVVYLRVLVLFTVVYFRVLNNGAHTVRKCSPWAYTRLIPHNVNNVKN